jgi:hypothetical protein
MAERYSDVATGREQQASLIRDMLMSRNNPEEKANEIA